MKPPIDDRSRAVSSEGTAQVVVAVHCVAFGFHETDLCVLLSREDASSSARALSIPGGTMCGDESLEDAARRQLARVGISERYLEQLGAFATRGGDYSDGSSAERVVVVAYYALANVADHRPDATEAMVWVSLPDLPTLATHFHELITQAVTRLRERHRSAAIGFALLPPRFSLTQLQRLYEAIRGVRLDKRNFRKKVLASGLIVETDHAEHGVQHRAAKLYRFDRAKYDRLVKSGFEFAV